MSGIGGLVAGLLTDPLKTIKDAINGAGTALDSAVSPADNKLKDAQPGTDMIFGQQSDQNKLDLSF
jgi:hypothetical protein